MTTLPIRAGVMPQFSPSAAVARVAAVISAVLDVYAEALHQASEAEKRYPFASNE